MKQIITVLGEIILILLVAFVVIGGMSLLFNGIRATLF